MGHFITVDQTFPSATVTAPVHVCEELLKLRGSFSWQPPSY